MSLYSEHEICAGCKHATFYDCGKCLRSCAVNAQGDRDHCSVSCTRRERVEEKP